MRPEELRESIRQAAANFTDEVIAIFGQAFTGVAADFSPRPAAVAAPVVAKRGPGRPPRAQAAAIVAPVPAAKKRNVAVKPVAAPIASKRIRRSANDLDKAGDEVIQLLAAHKNGMRVEEINRHWAPTPKNLCAPS